MSLRDLKFSNQIKEEQIKSFYHKNFNYIVTERFYFQQQWLHAAYNRFKDFDKYLILIHLVHKTFKEYGDYQIKNSFYDAVILHTLVSHVPKPEVVIFNAFHATKKNGLIVIFDADYASLQISSGDHDLDYELNSAIKAGCVAQPYVMRNVPFIVKDLNLDLIHCNSDLLFEVQESEFFVSMAKALSSMVVKAGNLKKDIAEEVGWYSKEFEFSQDFD